MKKSFFFLRNIQKGDRLHECIQSSILKKPSWSQKFLWILFYWEILSFQVFFPEFWSLVEIPSKIIQDCSDRIFLLIYLRKISLFLWTEKDWVKNFEIWISKFLYKNCHLVKRIEKEKIHKIFRKIFWGKKSIFLFFRIFQENSQI